MWRLKVFGGQERAVTLPQLQSMVRIGAVHPSSLVCAPESADWIRIELVPELMERLQTPKPVDNTDDGRPEIDYESTSAFNSRDFLPPTVGGAKPP